MSSHDYKLVTYLAEDQVAVLEDLAYTLDVRRASLVRMALQAYVQQNGMEWPGRGQ